MPSVLWHCWFGIRKSTRPVKSLSDEVLVWLSAWRKVQTICIWFSLCRCYLIISCFIKIQNGLPFWCWLTQVVLERRLLNGTILLLLLHLLLLLVLVTVTEYQLIHLCMCTRGRHIKLSTVVIDIRLCKCVVLCVLLMMDSTYQLVFFVMITRMGVPWIYLLNFLIFFGCWVMLSSASWRYHKASHTLGWLILVCT